MPQCIALCYRSLQCVAVCCSVSQCAAVCCRVLQCMAVCCCVLQCVAVRDFYNVLSLLCILGGPDKEERTKQATINLYDKILGGLSNM